MFYLFQSDQTKNKKVLIFADTTHRSRQILKWGSTLAARNSALKTPLPTPLCHTYFGPSRHEDSPGTTWYIAYLFKKLSKSRLSDRFFGLFLVICEVSYIYIAKTVIFKIWVFWVKTMHSITLYAIDIHNIRCLEPFLPLFDHFKIWRFLALNWQY